MEARPSGRRVDSFAALAAILAFVLAKQGRVPRKGLEDLVGEKLGRWRSETLIDAFVGRLLARGRVGTHRPRLASNCKTRGETSRHENSDFL